MYQCEQCGSVHKDRFGSGRFCCRSCANKWVALHQSEEAKARKVAKGAANLTHTWKGRKGPSSGMSTDSEKYIEELLFSLGVPYCREKKISIGSLGGCKPGSYSLDFYFQEASLDLEIDGTSHLKEERMLRDSERDTLLMASGILVRRIPFNGDFEALRRDTIKVLTDLDLIKCIQMERRC